MGAVHYYSLTSVELRLNMKVLLLLPCLVVLARSQSADWTCEECLEGGAALGDFLSGEEMMSGTTDLLVAEVCPQYSDPAYCQERLPVLWAAIGPVVWKEHYCHICDDREDCPHPECEHEHPFRADASVPACDSCMARVNAACDALAWEDTIAHWIGDLSEWCVDNSDQLEGSVEECQQAMAVIVPVAFPVLVNADRGWVNQFCMTWGSCQY